MGGEANDDEDSDEQIIQSADDEADGPCIVRVVEPKQNRRNGKPEEIKTKLEEPIEDKVD